MAKLDGKRVLITGGTTGIGLAAAQLFGQEGARVAITGVNPERLEEARRALGSNVAVIRADAADVGQTRAAVAQAADALGGLDDLFLNAGITEFSSLADVTEESFDRQFGVNVKGVLFAVQAAVQRLSDGASIVVNTSVNNSMGMGGTLIYGATKAAARAMVRVLAGELASRRIRVNAISPGPVETPIYGKLGLPPEQLQAIAGGLAQKIPLGRFGQPDEIARAVAFLASDDASFITGVELVADGGWTQVMP